MKLIGASELDDFMKKHADSRASILAWIAEAEEAEWKSPLDIKARYVRSSILEDNQVVFRLRGNRYRLLVKINYSYQIVLVKRIGTHEDYASWNF